MDCSLIRPRVLLKAKTILYWCFVRSIPTRVKIKVRFSAMLRGYSLSKACPFSVLDRSIIPFGAWVSMQTQSTPTGIDVVSGPLCC